MMLLPSMLHSLFVVAVLVAKANGQVGEGCGIAATDVLNPDYVAAVLVGGAPGCTIGSATDCYCNHGADGYIDNNEWVWVCGDDFLAPLANKTCPQFLPEGECDPTTQPSGLPGDPGCGYSDCGGSATYSAFCGCVDLSSFGAGEGFFWTCLKGTCDCPEGEQQSTSGSAVKAMSVLSFGLSTPMLLIGSM